MAPGRDVHVEDPPPELRAQEAAPLDTGDWEAALVRWASEELIQRGPGERPPLLDIAVPRFERIMIEAALKHTGGRRRDASLLLGWGRNTLTRKIHELHMDVMPSEE